MSIIKPYKNNHNKKTQIKTMFDNISQHYDKLNCILSFRMDVVWRKIAAKHIQNNPKKILDIATGTGELAITTAKYTTAQIIGIDISHKMIEIGKKKIKNKKLKNRISLQVGDAEKLTFEDNSFDAITAGFGIRNFENMHQGIAECYRTLKKNGILIVLEPSTPSIPVLKQIYRFYFSYLMPLLGKIISKDKHAYQYLHDSVKAFPVEIDFLKILKKTGFKKCKHKTITFGIVSLYYAVK